MKTYTKGTKGYYRPNRLMFGELEILYPSSFGYVCKSSLCGVVEITSCDFCRLVN